MRIFFCLYLSMLFVFCCNSSNTDSEFNRPPNQPNEPVPANNSSHQPLTLNLSWACSDPDGDALLFDVYLGLNNDPPIVSESQSETAYETHMLDYNTTYYWRVTAKDNFGNSTNSPIWRFSTQDEPYLSVVPSWLKFYGIYEGDNPEPQNLHIENAGGGTLNYWINDFEDWLVFSDYVGTTPETVTVSVNLEGMPVNRYGTEFEVIAAEASNSPLILPCSLIISYEQILVFQPDSLDFGADEDTLQLSISNSGTGILIWALSEDHYWLEINPQNGEVSSETDTVAFTVDRNDLFPGAYYNEDIELTTNIGDSSVHVSVFVPIPGEPTLYVWPRELDFCFTGYQKIFYIYNVGNGGRLEWALNTNQSWLNVYPVAGITYNFGQYDTIYVDVDTSIIEPGNYEGIIEITSNGGNDSIDIFVDISSYGEPHPYAHPTIIDLTPDQPVAYIYLDNTGGSRLTWNFNYNDDVLGFYPPGGFTDCEIDTIRVSGYVSQNGWSSTAYMNHNGTGGQVIFYIRFYP